MRAAGENTSSPVETSCTVSPSTTVFIAGPGVHSSVVTRYGPNGVVFSKVLPCSHCSVRYWKSLIVTSLSTA